MRIVALTFQLAPPIIFINTGFATNGGLFKDNLIGILSCRIIALFDREDHEFSIMEDTLIEGPVLEKPNAVIRNALISRPTHPSPVG